MRKPESIAQVDKAVGSDKKKGDQEKKSKRVLKARRAIENYFEDKYIESLSGKNYWDVLS